MQYLCTFLKCFKIWICKIKFICVYPELAKKKIREVPRTVKTELIISICWVEIYKYMCIFQAIHYLMEKIFKCSYAILGEWQTSNLMKKSW